jgi:hypothetical protein
VTDKSNKPVYWVVHDGGAGDGMIEAGPFDLPTKAVKKKNELDRTSHFMCEFRVQEVLDHDRR